MNYKFKIINCCKFKIINFQFNRLYIIEFCCQQTLKIRLNINLKHRIKLKMKLRTESVFFDGDFHSYIKLNKSRLREHFVAKI